jgi:phytoene synthase
MSEALMQHATQTIEVGSKSFAAAAKLFPPATRRSVLMLYAWCRHCDDVVDGQELGFNTAAPALATHDARAELGQLYDQTRRAYAGEPMLDPAFAAFQEVALSNAIAPRYAFDHLAGFAMDVDEARYETIDDTLRYCYHVAGVVGLMMASIMGARDERVLDRACDLGLAFQLTNIARDIVEDANGCARLASRRTKSRCRATGWRSPKLRRAWSTMPSPITTRPRTALRHCPYAARGRSPPRAMCIARSGSK